MATLSETILRDQLLERQRRLESSLALVPDRAHLERLLSEVDAALQRMEDGTYGICEACHESVEPERLLSDPLLRFCLSHLTAEEQRALEQDLQLAARIQRALLPRAESLVGGWEVAYHYQPAGPVSGDYCDLVAPEGAGGPLFFALGDISGKGVAASMLMSHLHALIRSLLQAGTTPEGLVERANRIFCESTMPNSFATLICGRASGDGTVAICNAGHLPALLVREEGVTRVEATGLPVGIFCESRYPVREVRMEKADSLFLFTDGLTEAEDAAGADYGIERLAGFLGSRRTSPPPDVLAACLDDLRSFRTGGAARDDLTMMVLRRTA